LTTLQTFSSGFRVWGFALRATTPQARLKVSGVRFQHRHQDTKTRRKEFYPTILQYPYHLGIGASNPQRNAQVNSVLVTGAVHDFDWPAILGALTQPLIYLVNSSLSLSILTNCKKS
jgi:hypothetical protein